MDQSDFAEELLHCLRYGKQGKRYSENVRQFSMAMSYYSPNAYRYLRSVFNDYLPHPRTMRGWLSSVDGSPGISSQALDSLKKKAEEYKSTGKNLLVSMMCDEMSIRKKVNYNSSKNNFTGYATCENQFNQEEGNQNKGLPEAKNSFVFMVVGEDFKIPVGYFLLNGLNGYERAALTHLVISKVNETGAKVIALTQVDSKYIK